MAPSVLGVGIPASSKFVPEDRREGLQKVLEFMESDMQASPYDWEFYDVDPEMDFGLVVEKLRSKKWDVVMVGGKFSVSSFCAVSEYSVGRDRNADVCACVSSGSSHGTSAHSIFREDRQCGARGFAGDQDRVQHFDTGDAGGVQAGVGAEVLIRRVFVVVVG